MTALHCIFIGACVVLPSAICAQPIQIDTGAGGHAAETSISSASATCILPRTEMVAAWIDYRNGLLEPHLGVAISDDQFGTWTETFSVVKPLPIDPLITQIEFDPATAGDNRTGYLFVAGISEGGGAVGGRLFVARKPPCQGSPVFEPAVVISGTGNADKPWMAAGRRHNDPNSTRVYIGYKNRTTASEYITWSDDLGLTWIAPRPIPGGVGLWGTLPRIGPLGELYIQMYDDVKGQLLLQKSLDSGVTFLAKPLDTIKLMTFWSPSSITLPDFYFPGVPHRVPPWGCFAVSPISGHLHVSLMDRTSVSGSEHNFDVYHAVSTNQGTSWSIPKIVNGDSSPPSDQVLPWIEVDSQDRPHVLFYDTRGVAQLENDVPGYYQAYHARAPAGTQNWSETALTTQWPMYYPNAQIPTLIGDYVGMAIGDSFAIPCYAMRGVGIAPHFDICVSRVPQ